MKRLMYGILLLMMFALTACSEETSKDEKSNNTTEETKTTESVVEEKENNTKEYSFEDFVKMSDQEQQDFIIPFVNDLGYDNDLALKLLTFINDENSDIRDHFKSVNAYVTYYIESSDLSGNKLETETADTDNQLPEEAELSEEIIDQRLAAIKGKPLFEITDTNQLTILGISIGNSFQDVISMFGEEDAIGKVKEGGVVYDQYVYRIPAVSKGNNHYQLIVRYGDNGETPDAITKIRLRIDNNGEVKPSLEIPEEFTNSFQGEVYFHTPIDHPFINEGGTYTLDFLHNTGVTQGLEIYYKSNDFDLRAEVWGQDQLHVFETQTKAIYDEISMEDAKKALRFEDSKSE